MDYETLLNKTHTIIDNLNFLDNNITQLKKKSNVVHKVYQRLEANKILINDPRNTYLIFQINMLKNENGYYKNMYDIVISKYSTEIYELNEYLVMVLLTLHKLEIDNAEKNQQIFHKIMSVKNVGQINYGKINEIINAIINNLKLIEEFVKLFEEYISRTIQKNKKNNIHNNNFELSVSNKKESILLEYRKYCDKFERIINYFTKCTNSINYQINNSQILKFFLT